MGEEGIFKDGVNVDVGEYGHGMDEPIREWRVPSQPEFALFGTAGVTNGG